MPPIIGLTTYGTTEAHTKTNYYDSHYAIPSDYVNAVRRAGGVPLLIPPGDGEWQQIVKAVDAVIFTGGTDIDPSQYKGDTENPKVYPPDKMRDKTEIDFVRYLAQSKDKPVLCICRGMQVLNVALGGTMHPHIPDIMDNDMHRSADGWWTLHDCQVETDSHLERIMGAKTVNTYSGHHQAVKDVAPNLQVVSKAADGIIEALTLPDHPFMLGVQWHPEKSAHNDITQQRLFDALVEAVSVRV
ncbi:MAG: gamma-glutamyl-gamma-aminobutyrate hydrolase family protein [Anaerolineae bacterium]|nr:gamma-glutamyl-gamma-aminobutyrate hydrolase family protein [Anaerolineae bacterium]MDQ7034528.1 gamma-glutamyl-gamma-aminobutyrate hydrolase family protein [Anaerolineae bacterium]